MALKPPLSGAHEVGSEHAAGPLDILINNAAQTIRRSREAYAPLIAGESQALPAGLLPEIRILGTVSAAFGEVAALESVQRLDVEPNEVIGSVVPVDAGGLVPDVTDINSWSKRVHEIDPVELLEVQLCNVTAPFLLVSPSS